MSKKKLIADERTKALFTGFGKIGCTREEIAAMLGCSRVTLWKFLEANPEMDEALEASLDIGKVTLRRLQWRQAHKGNVTMLIWLGKQLLKQRDQVSTEDGNARESIEALRIELERKLARIADSGAESEVSKDADSA